MPLTPAQQQTVKADIAANPDLNSKPNTPDGNFAIADLYSLTAVPDHWVYRTNVPQDEITQKPSQDGTSFTWTTNGFISRTPGEIACWEELFTAGYCNPSLPNVRQAFQDIFSGSGAAANNRTHLTTVARRKSTRIEKLLATGVGNTANPAVMGFEGKVNYAEIAECRNLP